MYHVSRNQSSVRAMHLTFPSLVHDKKSIHPSNQVQCRPTLFCQFTMYFLLPCHMNGFGLGGSDRQEEQVHSGYVMLEQQPWGMRGASTRKQHDPGVAPS